MAVKKIEVGQMRTSAAHLNATEDFFYHSFECKIDDRKIIFAKPTTMMNGSGGAVVALLNNLGLPPSEMLVVVDDFNVPLGTIRFRQDGSDGGHNGLESIIAAIQSDNFPRLRLGIGPVSKGEETVDFVLGKFSKSEEKIAKKMIDIAVEAVIFATGHRFDETMLKYNYNPV